MDALEHSYFILQTIQEVMSKSRNTTMFQTEDKSKHH